MHVIRHTAHSFWKAAKSGDRPAEVLVKARTLTQVDQRLAVLRAEDEVIVKAEVGGRHRR
jgi:hypothetical protein